MTAEELIAQAREQGGVFDPDGGPLVVGWDKLALEWPDEGDW